jgi:hypothetical protein
MIVTEAKAGWIFGAFGVTIADLSAGFRGSQFEFFLLRRWRARIRAQENTTTMRNKLQLS